MAHECPKSNDLCTSKISLFSSLDVELQRKLISQATHKEITKGDYIFDEGSKADFILVLNSGRIKLNRYDVEGKEFIIDILVSGDTTGEDLILSQGAFPYNALALEDSNVCLINRTSLLEIIKGNPLFSISLIEELSTKLESANHKINILSESDALIRLSSFLLERSTKKVDGIISLSVDDIAASINLRRETVSRKLTELQSLGYIERRGQKSIVIKNSEKLLEIFKN